MDANQTPFEFMTGRYYMQVVNSDDAEQVIAIVVERFSEPTNLQATIFPRQVLEGKENTEILAYSIARINEKIPGSFTLPLNG